MTDIIEVLEQRAASYDQSGPSAKHTADLLRFAKLEITHLRAEADTRKQAEQVFRDAIMKRKYPMPREIVGRDLNREEYPV